MASTRTAGARGLLHNPRLEACCLWLLLSTSLFMSACGEVTVFDDYQNTYRAMDCPSDFGPMVPTEGMKGRLYVASPDVYGCMPLTLNVTSDDDNSPLFVLIQRSPPNGPQRCTFEDKVRQAQNAGAALAIIYDYQDEPLVRMKSESEEGITIPSVFILFSSGRALTDLASRSHAHGGPVTVVDNQDPYPELVLDTLNLTLLGLVIGFLLFVLVCGAFFFCSNTGFGRRRQTIQTNKEVLPLSEVLALPDVVVGPNTRGTCCVCLEGYAEGDTLKQLPCLHLYHPDCIIPWLTERQRTCPLCKEPANALPTDPLIPRERGVIEPSPPAQALEASSNTPTDVQESKVEVVVITQVNHSVNASPLT